MACKDCYMDVFVDVVNYINNNLDEKHTLKSINQRFYINKNIMEDLFLSTYNLTFYQYVMYKRFEKACYYLRFTNLSTDYIALKIGISSSQNFSRFFKALSGTTPKLYRAYSANTQSELKETNIA